MGARKTPILLRESPISGAIMVLTRYTWKLVGKREILQAAVDGKHDVTADFDALMLQRLLGDDCPKITATLDGAARAMELSDDELNELVRLRASLVAIIERHNARFASSPEQRAEGEHLASFYTPGPFSHVERK